MSYEHFNFWKFLPYRIYVNFLIFLIFNIYTFLWAHLKFLVSNPLFWMYISRGGAGVGQFGIYAQILKRTSLNIIQYC